MSKMDKNQVIALLTGRPVYIWGAMIVGQGVCRAFERLGIPVRGFLDSSASLQGTRALGFPVSSPGEALLKAKSGEAYIVIGSGHHDRSIEEICRSHGLQLHRDFLPSRELNDVDPSVDVSGACNLHCISCPQGNITDRPETGFISVDDYQLILDKLLRELPFLGSIQLYAWGEPLLHRQLPEIISRTREARVLTAISTNLKLDRGLKEVVEARPDWIKVSTSGFGSNYEIGHTGGNWERFLGNLRRLAALRDERHPDMQIILNYHLYKHSTGDSYRAMRDLCQEIGLIFRPNMAYLYSLDNVLDHVEQRKLSDEATQTLDMLLMDIDEGLRRAKERRHLPCPEERCLPINWDRRVRFCGVYFKPFIADDFLKTSVADILERRRTSDFCAHCMSHGLHHYTGVYLEERILGNGEVRPAAQSGGAQ
jgi:hypothetical protein